MRRLLLAGLLLTSAFAGWVWFRPYEWNSDPNAGFKIMGAGFTPDESFAWVELHLKANTDAPPDLENPVRLELPNNAFVDPADTTMTADRRELWFKFWVKQEDLKGRLLLHLNNGKLVVKATDGVPAGSSRSNTIYFTTNRW